MVLPVPSSQIKQRLLEDGLIEPNRFQAFLEEAERKNQSLIDILVSEHVADAGYFQNLIATSLNVPLANLGSRVIKQDALHLLSEEIARQRQVAVFDEEPGGVLDVAMLDPSDLGAITFLEQHLKRTIRVFLASLDDLNRAYAIYGSKSNIDFKKIIEENVQQSLRSQTKSGEDAAADLPIVAIADNILGFASASRASDVHIEVLEEETLIRYRIDGILQEVARIPRSVHAALVARFKILGGLKIDEHYRPQDGRFRHKITGQNIDVRVSVMPTFYGEKVEMRLLESSQKPLSLEELGMLPDTAKIVSENLSKAYGMVIICGPTGSGKTSTLYAIMNILNRPNVNIVTVEDPIEYNMRYVNQSQINPQAGITFASGLRALLRQDPNVIMVGEIRDNETADIAVQAALTGHLLLSSLHTNDAPTAIPRLFDLGVPSFLVGSTLNLLVAQRLVRKVCPICIYSYDPGSDVSKTIKNQLLLIAEDGVAEKLIPKVFYRGKGCSACGGSGYRGRFGIFEVIPITDSIKRVLSEERFDLDKLKNEARKEGSATMFEDGLVKIQMGLTTIEEVLRVIRE